MVAERLGGTEIKFARMMTKKARQLGMTKTSFRNASGLPHRKQVTTARDMARLSRALIKHFPDQYNYFSTRFFQYGGRRFKNHNALLKSYNGADGIKTGYIRASGFNLAASAERNGRRVIAVVFGGRTARSRNREMKRLLDIGFKKSPRVFVNAPVILPRRNPLRVAHSTPAIAPAAGQSIAPVSAAAFPVDAATGKAMKGVQMPRRNPFYLPLGGEAQAARLNRISPAARGRKDSTATWQVQVGAFSGFEQAQAAAAQAAARLTRDTQFHGISVDSDGDRPVYRARLVGFSDIRLAARACAQLRKRSFDCFVTRDEQG